MMEILVGMKEPVQPRLGHLVRVMLLTDQPDGTSARRLAGLACLCECENDQQTALSKVIADPVGYDLFVMDCDPFGGIAAGEEAVAALIAANARMRVMLISREFDMPAYPWGRRSAVCLPNPVSEGAFRFGFNHVMRDWVLPTMM